jgi:hypothetical protein
MRLPSGASRAEGRLDITHTTRRRGRTGPLRQEPFSRPGNPTSACFEENEIFYAKRERSENLIFVKIAKTRVGLIVRALAYW